MKILLSSIGSRGDVQPVLALAQELLRLGHEPRLCVAPNFKEWVESFRLTCIPIGPDLQRITARTAPAVSQKPSVEQRRQWCNSWASASRVQLGRILPSTNWSPRFVTVCSRR
jgi:vancomycin aglycone glucosyltransferase